MGLKAEIWASRLECEPQGWDLGLKVGIWAEFSNIWQNLVEFGRIWQNLAEFGRSWQNLTEFCKIWQNLDLEA